MTYLSHFEGTEARVLRILYLEDSSLDAELVQSELAGDGLRFELVRVQTRADFAAALEEGAFDLILADYALPGFDGLSALDMAREIRPGLPIILILGAPSEEVAIESLKKGATDYVLRHRLQRLLPAVRRVLREAEERIERERAEEALHRTEIQFRVLVEQIPAAIYIQQLANSDSNGANPTLYASPQIEEQTGYPPQDFVEDPELWIKLIHPEDRERVLAEDRLTDETGEPFRAEYRVITRDGRVQWIRDEAILVQDEEGRSRFWQGVMFDITEHKRAGEEIRQSEERFRATFEQAAVGMAHVSPDGRWLRVNQRLCDILGYAREELLEKTFQEITHPDDLEADLDQTRKLLAGEIDTGSMEKRYIKNDGRIVWCNLTVSLVRQPSGEPGYFISAIEDITDRKRAEEALRQSEGLYRSVIEQAAENIFIIDADTKQILEASATVNSSLGYTADELREMTLYDVVAHDRESIDEDIWRILMDRRGTLGERKYRCKDGSLVTVEANVSVVPYGGDEAMCIVAHDITERLHAERELHRHLGVLLGLREAGQVLGSTLKSDEIATRLLEIMRGVANLTAAVISIREGDDVRVWRSVGLETLWRRVRFVPEARNARLAALEHQERHLLRLRHPDSADGAEGSLAALYLPLKVKDRVVGVLEAYGPESLAQDDTVEVLISLTNQAASALENAQLYEELGARERALQDLVGKLLGAQEEERRRVAYEVHDGLAQVASAAHQHLQAFARRYSPEAEKGKRDLERIVRLVRGTVSDARRIIANLRPTTLDDLGLAATISLEVERLGEEGYEVDYEENLGSERLPSAVEIALFRIAQEALTNVRKHARASWVRVELGRREHEVRLEVTDRGRGFDPTAQPLESGPGERVGLAGMRERVGLLGGGLEISSRVGAGTTVVATIPVTRASHTQ